MRERCADLLYDDAVRSAQARDPPLDSLPDRIGARLLRRDILGWVLALSSFAAVLARALSAWYSSFFLVSTPSNFSQTSYGSLPARTGSAR